MEKRGTDLHPNDQRHVLDTYVHRMTVEARRRWPAHARRMIDGGYRMPPKTDALWLATTWFRVRGDGRLDLRVKHCRTA